MTPTLTPFARTGAAIVRLGALAAVVAAALGHTVPASAGRQSSTPRLYVLDCGRLEGRNLERYNLPNEERAMSVSCILVVHSRGTLLWEAGLGDQFVGGQVTPADPGWRVAQTLQGQLAEIGYEPSDITYLAISHMHGDHTGNANDYAGATWLVQRAELEVAFTDSRNTAPYDALRNSATLTLTGDHDVFGDDTVVIKSTPGHTPGHQSLFVRLAAAGPNCVEWRPLPLPGGAKPEQTAHVRVQPGSDKGVTSGTRRVHGRGRCPAVDSARHHLRRGFEEVAGFLRVTNPRANSARSSALSTTARP